MVPRGDTGQCGAQGSWRSAWDLGMRAGRFSPCPSSFLLRPHHPPPNPPMPSQVFLVRKVTRPDSGHLYAMKVLKKATLKGEWGASPEEPQAGQRRDR